LSQSLRQRSPQLDLLRTTAIALVFTTHFRIFAGHDWFGTIGPFGWAGVDLFFVLSGFLIASQLFRAPLVGKRISLGEFYFRRGLRIWPNYTVVLAVYFLVPAVLERGTLPPLWRFLTFTQNLGLDYRTSGAFSHAWSLCVEEHFYLVLPLAIPVLVRWGGLKRAVGLLGGVVLGGMALRFGLWETYVAPLAKDSGEAGAVFYREIYYPTYCRLDGLAVGVAIAALFRLRPVAWAKLAPFANFFFFGGLAAIGAAFALGIEDHSQLAAVFEFPLVATGFGGLVVAGLLPEGVFARIRIPGVEATATLAFSFYLVHKSVIHLASVWLVGRGIAPASFSYLFTIVVACVIVSIALYFAVERPSLAWRDRRSRA
jgi:peptidoglycan/LPS O-acetylase OafA/YrhL